MNSMPVGADSTSEVSPQIPDHVLLRRIGKGAYGEVWLARNMTGAFRAVKVIYRRTFMDERPFQREFEGICRFEPISRSHQGLVTILHVGQNASAGYFYYVMELADDARTGQIIGVESYVPKTLREELSNQRRLPLHKQLEIALSLASALEYLHARNLIHRDIKPPNIIFVNGLAKFADVGLMVEAGEEVSAVCTLGFVPPEGPGLPTADIFSLGKVFYELFMGLPCKRFPELPGAAEEFTAVPALLQLNNLVLKACDNDPRQRFQNATELHDALRAVAEMVPVDRPVAATTRADGPDSSKAGPEARPKKATANAADASQGRAITSGGEPRPKVLWSRRAALIGLGGAVTGGTILSLSLSRDPIVVLMDTTAPGGIYDPDNSGPGASNTTEIQRALKEMNLVPPLRLHAEPIDLKWNNQHIVRGLRPDLVIIHRSSFYHPVNYVLKFGPASEMDSATKEKWEVVYRLANEKLVDFMGYVGSHVRRTKFLVYSRGTDPEWLNPAYRDSWVRTIERTYPELGGRITTMVVPSSPGTIDGSFRKWNAREVLRTNVVSILGLPANRESGKND